MKGYLINPYNQSIIHVICDGTIDSMYAMLDCDMVEAFCVDRATGDTCWLDEEGLLKEQTHYFSITGFNQMFAGKALILGNENGECVDAKSSYDDIVKRITFAILQPGEYKIPPITITVWD